MNTPATEYRTDGMRFIRTTDIVDVNTLTDDTSAVYVDPGEVAPEYMLRHGDLLFSRSGTLGRCLRFQQPEIASTFAGYLVRFRPRPDLASSRYIGYCAQAAFFQEGIAADAVSSTISNFNAEKYAELRLPWWPVSSQDAIADFLDRETARIDALIAAKRRMIALVDDRYRSLVSAVTDRGKPARVRHVTSLRTSGPRGWAERVSDVGLPFVRSANLRRDSIALRGDNLAFVDPPNSVEANRSRTIVDDVVVGITGANTGWVGLIDSVLAGGFVSQHVAILRPGSIEAKWLCYSLFADRSQQQLLGGQYGGTKQQLGLEDLGELTINYPSVVVQREGVARLDRASTATTTLKQRMMKQVDLLVEHRQALMTAAVTGEIDVKAVAAA